MRILLAAYDPGSSGIATYTLELAALLSDAHEVVVLSRGPFPLRVAGEYRFPRKPIPRYLPLWQAFADSEYVRDTIERVQPDVVHETLPPTAYVAQHLVTTDWGYASTLRLSWLRSTTLEFPENLGGLPVTLQHTLGNSLSRLRASARVQIFGPAQWSVQPPIQVQACKEYGPARPLKILFVSRKLTLPRKNLKVVRDAIPLVGTQCELHVVGAGTFPQGAVPHGWMDRRDLIRLMRTMDVLVLPSLYEELGYVGQEACSVGLPVVASDIPIFRRLLPHALFFDPYSPQALARLLERLDGGRLKRAGELSYRRVRENQESTLDRLNSIYDRVARKRPGE